MRERRSVGEERREDEESEENDGKEERVMEGRRGGREEG